MLPSANNNKIPLANAANDFATLCRAMDEGNLDETVSSIFDASGHDLVASSVDRFICSIDMVRNAISWAEENQKSWKQRHEQFKHIKERVDELMLTAMKVKGVREFNGTIGRLCAQNNAEALHLEFETFKPHVGNVIDPAMIEHHNIPEKYIKKFAAFQIDTALVKEDLKNGAKFSWASLTRGQQLRARQG